MYVSTKMQKTLLTLKDCSIDRVIATCLLSHLKDPENAY